MKLETRFKAGDMFDELIPENEQEVDRKVEIQKNSALERIIDISEKYLNVIRLLDVDSEYYKLAEVLIPKDYTSKDITTFSTILKNTESPGEFMGRYVSALINHSEEQDFLFYSDGYADGIGYKNNGKNITVIGDGWMYLGEGMENGVLTIKGNHMNECLGIRMSGGLIIVEGNSGFNTGDDMTGGKIIVKGNAEKNLGSEMKKGDIVVEGNAGLNIGEAMTGGNIHLNGDYQLSDRINGGNIYHKGKPIVLNGRKVSQ